MNRGVGTCPPPGREVAPMERQLTREECRAQGEWVEAVVKKGRVAGVDTEVGDKLGRQ